MLRDKVKKYIEHELIHGDEREFYHYNCAESILNGSNEYYDLNIDKRALKMITPFGGGMYSESTCGMLTGGIAVIGIMFAEEMPTKHLKLKEITRYWIEEFEAALKNINCRLIKDINLKRDEGCANLILKAADILEGVVEKYKGDITMK